MRPVFVDPKVRVVELYHPSIPSGPGTRRLGLFDPGTMPIYWLDDGMFSLPGNLKGKASSPVAFFANDWVKAPVYKLGP